MLLVHIHDGLTNDFTCHIKNCLVLSFIVVFRRIQLQDSREKGLSGKRKRRQEKKMSSQRDDKRKRREESIFPLHWSSWSSCTCAMGTFLLLPYVACMCIPPYLLRLQPPACPGTCNSNLFLPGPPGHCNCSIMLRAAVKVPVLFSAVAVPCSFRFHCDLIQW